MAVTQNSYEVEVETMDFIDRQPPHGRRELRCVFGKHLLDPITISNRRVGDGLDFDEMGYVMRMPHHLISGAKIKIGRNQIEVSGASFYMHHEIREEIFVNTAQAFYLQDDALLRIQMQIRKEVA